MESPLRLGLALPLLFLSGMIAATARRTLSKNKAGFRPGDRSGNLVATGIYRFSRHPMYLSLVILFVGVAFLINSIYLLGITPVLVVILHFGVIIKEEKLLEHYFGDAYLQYKKQVRRWL
jgi:protein-S-isoprenylcysteine O-methyltransferase Ste14